MFILRQLLHHVCFFDKISLIALFFRKIAVLLVAAMSMVNGIRESRQIEILPHGWHPPVEEGVTHVQGYWHSHGPYPMHFHGTVDYHPYGH
jgi:hypothetical protein